MRHFVEKYKSVIAYLFFGGMTTLINIFIYGVLYEIVHFPNVGSTVIAWIIAVLFAFITNRKWVFKSRAISKVEVGKELMTFFSCRGGTGLLDLGTMVVTVDILKWNAIIMKLLANIIVITLNYVFSKYFVFKR